MKEEPPRPPRYRANRGFSFERFYLENRRFLIWVILGLLLWQLRSFFSLIFLTFAIAFIAAPISEFFVKRARMPRRLAICAAFDCPAQTLLISASTFIVPQVAREAMNLVSNLPKTEQRLLELRGTLLQRYPTVEPILMNYLRSTIPESLLAELPAKPDESGTTSGTEPPRSRPPRWVPPPGRNGGTGPDANSGRARTAAAAKEDEAVIHLFLGYQIKRLTNAAPGMIRAMWAARPRSCSRCSSLPHFPGTCSVSARMCAISAIRGSAISTRKRPCPWCASATPWPDDPGPGDDRHGQPTLLTFIGLSLLGVPSLSVLSLIVFPAASSRPRRLHFDGAHRARGDQLGRA